MKKKCTNSACRRVFTPWLEAGTVKCPHCGKAYPRLKPAQARIPSLVVTGLTPDASKLAAIKLVRRVLHIGLRQSKERVENIQAEPIVISEFENQQPQALMAELDKLGMIARFDWSIPGSYKAPPPNRSYNVIMAGYAPGHKDDAEACLRELWKFRYASAEKLEEILRNRRVLLSRSANTLQTQHLKRVSREKGIHLEFRRLAK